jgi:hypothetical protein
MVRRVGYRAVLEYGGGAPPGSVVIRSVCKHQNTLVLYHEGIIYISYPMYGTVFSCSVQDVWQSSIPNKLLNLPEDITLLINEFIGIPMGYASSIWNTGPDTLRCFLNPSSRVCYNPEFPAIKCVYEPKPFSGTKYVFQEERAGAFYLSFPSLPGGDGTREAVFVDGNSWLRFKIPDGFLTKRNVPLPVRDTEMCSICMVNEKTTAFIPCGHATWCTPCAYKIHTCPSCRVNVSSRLRIYG